MGGGAGFKPAVLAEADEYGERDDAVSRAGRQEVRNAPVPHMCI